jgi:hypothetical protein
MRSLIFLLVLFLSTGIFALAQTAFCPVAPAGLNPTAPNIFDARPGSRCRDSSSA